MEFLIQNGRRILHKDPIQSLTMESKGVVYTITQSGILYAFN